MLQGTKFRHSQTDNQAAFCALSSQMTRSSSNVIMTENHALWSILNVIDVILDSKTFFVHVRLGAYLYLEVQASAISKLGSIVDDLEGYQSVDRIFSILDVRITLFYNSIRYRPSITNKTILVYSRIF
jgi:hypothetical protein